MKQMMKTRRIKKWLMGITTVALLAMQTVTAFASVESYSQTKLGSITITPGDQDHKGAAVDVDDDAVTGHGEPPLCLFNADADVIAARVA